MELELTTRRRRPGSPSPLRERPSRRAGAAASGCGGFSVIEVLIATLLLLFITIGIVPLFLQSTQSNLSGGDSTRATNFGKSRVEELMQLDFGSPQLQILAGTERTFDEYYRQGTATTDPEWLAGTVADATAASHIALWSRTRSTSKRSR